MSIFETLLLSGLILAALLSWGDWRAWGWLGAGAADYLFTTAYYDTGLPLHPFVTALTDAFVCIMIFKFGRFRWELPLFLAFQFAVLGSILRLMEFATPYQYALLLELANWAAILVIGGTGAMRLADGYLGDPNRNSGLHRAVRSLYTPTRFDPFWWARWALPTR